ncbi:unnamed protein product, partial [Musa acuminata subsp. burmannicoides]
CLRSPQCFERYYHGGGVGVGASEVGHVRADIDKGAPKSLVNKFQHHNDCNG